MTTFGYISTVGSQTFCVTHLIDKTMFVATTQALPTNQEELAGTQPTDLEPITWIDQVVKRML